MGVLSKSLFLIMRLYISLALLSVVLSQDTSYCPDGWTLSDFGGVKECIYFGNVQEQVTKTDASVLCAARGGWLLDLDEGRGAAKNNFIKSLLANHVGTGLGRTWIPMGISMVDRS